MCVIISKPTGLLISKADLKMCWDRNKDGAGFVARSEDVFETQTGIMSFDEYYEKIAPYIGKDFNLITHMRISSRGGVSDSLTHPFEVILAKKQKAYLFHNGTASCIDTLPTGWSDTKFVGHLLSGLSFKSACQFLTNLNSNQHGRFVLIQNDNTFIKGDDESKEVNGIWFSNLRHTTYVAQNQFKHQSQGVTHHHTPALMQSRHDIYEVPFNDDSAAEPTNYNVDECSKFVFLKRNGSKTCQPSKKDAIEVIADSYLSSPNEDLEPTIAILEDLYKIESLPLRHLICIAKLAQSGEKNAAEVFFESFN